MKNITLIAFILCLAVVSFAQCAYPADSAQENNRKQIYIPKDLDDCFGELKKIMTKEELEKFKNEKEDAAIGKVHFGLGMWIRNNWGLWSGSRLAKYFNDLGIYHPDDMSSIIFTSFHRNLNDTEIGLKEQIRHYQGYWYEKATEEFGKLKTMWQAEKEKYKSSSILSDYWQGEAGKKLIAMGRRALPFVMREIEQGDFMFNIPADKITGIAVSAMSEQERSKKWLEWWRANRDNPKWNMFILVVDQKDKGSQSLKGFELYSWKNSSVWHFSLLRGTDRLKREDEIKEPSAALESVEVLKSKLGQIKRGQYIYWVLNQYPELSYPPNETIEEIRAYCNSLGLELYVGKDKSKSDILKGSNPQ